MKSSRGDILGEATRLEEVQLVERARGGDTAAFGTLVRLYQRRAVSVAYRLVGNAEDAGDVSQEAFVRAYRCLDQLDDPARFGGWLMRVVSNLALNFRRSRASRPSGPLDDSAEAFDPRRPGTGFRLSEDREDGESQPEELRRAIDDAMTQLPDKQRLALVLFSMEGLPQKDVAEILECSVELVKWNVFQARKKLRELLEDFL